LDWKPVLKIDEAISMTALWYKTFRERKDRVTEFTYS